MSRCCLGLILVVSWWLLGGFCRVSVVYWWSCGAAAAETTAKIGSNKKRETVLLGLYAGLICLQDLKVSKVPNSWSKEGTM